jgi:hypothetical protein
MVFPNHWMRRSKISCLQVFDLFGLVIGNDVDDDVSINSSKRKYVGIYLLLPPILHSTKLLET